MHHSCNCTACTRLDKCFDTNIYWLTDFCIINTTRTEAMCILLNKEDYKQSQPKHITENEK